MNSIYKIFFIAIAISGILSLWQATETSMFNKSNLGWADPLMETPPEECTEETILHEGACVRLIPINEGGGIVCDDTQSIEECLSNAGDIQFESGSFTVESQHNYGFAIIWTLGIGAVIFTIILLKNRKSK